MSKKLIVVADDFGFSEAYNYGVIKAYKEGVVCTLSLMSTWPPSPCGETLAERVPGGAAGPAHQFCAVPPRQRPGKSAHAGKRRGNVLPQLSVEERESQ